MMDDGMGELEPISERGVHAGSWCERIGFGGFSSGFAMLDDEAA